MTKVRSQDLVLAVSQQGAFEIEPYERFVQQLTLVGGDHQREAIEVACRYLLGGQYPDLRTLADENWPLSPQIQEHYGNQRDRLLDAQQLGGLLSGSIDHATGTGKSYVIFGVAAVALASGLVDRVLVLCPSVTIEEGLTRKFRDLAADPTVMGLLPDESAVRVPSIVNAYEQTVPMGSICVENIHAAYDHSRSSIRDSFLGQGSRTLVVNDEAHHIYTSERGSAKEWLGFLLDPTFGFQRVLNLSGTCFIGDNYFPDVIHRYSLQQARSDRRIKDIRYWGSSQEFPSPEARWSAVLKNHTKNAADFPKIRPLTIFVCQKVDTAVALHQDFAAFLATTLEISLEKATARTLIVSSRAEHKANLAGLRLVDSAASKVEFIFSVSMLTEGWDVKNVLQIVPHEKRAFDSKLLISQVLGRGLRLLPDPYRGADASVIVFNHARWAPEMKRLFDDVWEDDQRIVSTSIAASPYHFTIDHLEVTRGAVPTADGGGEANGRAAGRPLHLLPQRETATVGALVDLGGRSEERRYIYSEASTPIAEVVADILAKLAARRLETGEPPDSLTAASLGAVISAALAEVGEKAAARVTQANRGRILAWLTPPTPKTRMAFRTTGSRLDIRSTSGLQAQSVGRSELWRQASVALRTDNGRAIRWPEHDAGQYDLLDAVLGETDAMPGKAVIQVTAASDWRTPVDVVLVSHEPERRFLRDLLKPQAGNGVRAWIKSPDAGFYAIPYVLVANGVVRNATFNPDWFLCVKDAVLVVETKADGDRSPENRAKLIGAEDHFRTINAARASVGDRCHFFFLSPVDYPAFFDACRDGTYASFVPRLQADLR